MSNETGYNGYTNWETWEVHNHLDSDMLAEWARDALETAIEDFSDVEGARGSAIDFMAGCIEEFVNDNAPETDGLYSSLMWQALQQVDYSCIAEGYVNDIPIYVAGYNMPGYLPDADPALFIDHALAVEYLADEIRNVGENADDENKAAEAEKLADEIDANAKDGQDLQANFDGYMYWLHRA